MQEKWPNLRREVTHQDRWSPLVASSRLGFASRIVRVVRHAIPSREVAQTFAAPVPGRLDFGNEEGQFPTADFAHGRVSEEFAPLLDLVQFLADAGEFRDGPLLPRALPYPSSERLT